MNADERGCDPSSFILHPLTVAIGLLGCGLAALSLLFYGEKWGIPTGLISRAMPLAQQLDNSINANVLAGGLALILPLTLAIATAEGAKILRVRGAAILSTVILGSGLLLTGTLAIWLFGNRYIDFRYLVDLL